MTHTPIITNATPTRFLNGTFECVDGAWQFVGIVVHGTDLQYDVDNGTPISGQITAIEFQTRSQDKVIATHARYPVSAPVCALVDAFASTDAPWYDPCHYPALSVEHDTLPETHSDTIAEQIAQTPDHLDSPSEGFSLETGDILSKKDIRAIFADTLKQPSTPPKNTVASDRFQDANVIALMHKSLTLLDSQDSSDSTPASEDEYKFA